MKVSLIAALSANRVIGGESGGIPWSLPRDQEHFRRYTAHKWMLVGRRTYGEMSGWFRAQTPIVLTRNRHFRPEHLSHRAAHSVADAIELARKSGARELVVSGGASVYSAALPLADRLILTTVETEVDGPATFPNVEKEDKWSPVFRERWPADEENEFDMVLTILDRNRNSRRLIPEKDFPR